MSKAKTVAVVFHEFKSDEVETIIIRSIADVFADTVKVKFIYTNIPYSEEGWKADLYLLIWDESLNQLNGKVENLSNVLTIARTLPKRALPKLLSIPRGSDVLVVNDSRQLTMQLTRNLMSLGFEGIHWIPYIEDEEPSGKYRGIQYSVTTNEIERVPSYIPNIIDVGERYIDSYTMTCILAKLQLGTKENNARLLEYSNRLIEPSSSIVSQYIGSYLKSSLLENFIQNSEYGFLLCDNQNNCVYMNEYVTNLYPKYTGSYEMFVKEVFPETCSCEYFTDMVSIKEKNYMLSKNPVWQERALLGFCYTIKDEKSIRDEDANLSQKLVNSGMRAKYTFDDICHASDIIAEIIKKSKLAAETDYPVLIQGESGTGKELFAQSIHNASARCTMPFVAINCAAIPAQLMESELFGYEGGAFTGARKEGKAGLLEQANGGTVFLDEIGDMAQDLQTLLLRTLQEKQIMRIGGDRVIPIDVRIICATNTNLIKAVEEKSFRADLYYRINSLPIYIPPLRERSEDIIPLLNYYLGPEMCFLSQADKEFLLRYDWPGNVRQLASFCNYFKTMHIVYDFFTFQGNVPTPSGMNIFCNTDDILKIVADNTTQSHGIGRVTLQKKLISLGKDCSDCYLRSVLENLKNENYIEVGRGRTGCRITEKGLDKIRRL